MSISMTKKQKIIQQLLATKTKAYQAEVKLLLKRKSDEASEIKNHGKKLSKKIDNLIAQTMSNWAGNSNKIIGDVKLINKKIQRSINNIQNNVNLTNNIAKLVGFIDEIVDIVDGIA